jgi:hypothetical protein
MRANPGGPIDPGDVVGRDGLIQQLWEALVRQSVALVAERRMGKTCVTRKMLAEAPAGLLAVWRDLEDVHSPLEFAEAVFHEVERYLSRWKRNALRARTLLAQLSGTKLGDKITFPTVARSHWKAILLNTMEDLAEHQQHTVVVFWDELPLMIKNIKDRCGEAEATEVLDTLRAIRQTHGRVRMFFTGSIGLHNVISSFRRRGYANAPINDMQVIDLPPLAPADAADLAGRLLEGEELAAGAAEGLAEGIAGAVDCIPYYIHHVVYQMKQRRTPCTLEAVGELVERSLTDDQDVWQLEHYRKRVDAYYEPDERPTVLALLDVVAAAKGPVAFTDVFRTLKAHMPTEDREKALDLLTLLRHDHYLTQDADGRYRFRYGLIQRWWRLHRGL